MAVRKMQRIKLGVIAALFTLLLLPSALAIDTSPYDRLLADISSKQADLEKARMDEDWEAVVTLNKQLDSLNAQLVSPQMVVLKKYPSLKMALDESKYLMLEMVEALPAESISRFNTQFASAQEHFSLVESAYASGNYSGTLLLLRDWETEIALMPETLASAAAKATDDLMNQVQRTSTLTPSMIPMMDNAKKKLLSAQQAYKQAAQKALASDRAGTDEFLRSGHALASDAFELLARAATEKGDDLSSIRFALVLVPLALVAGLLAYFYLMFNKSPLKCAVSRTEIHAGSEEEIERRIEVVNISKSRSLMNLVDTPPAGFHPHGFSDEPMQMSSGALMWDMDLEQGAKKTIRYKLRSERLEKGKKIQFPTARLSYGAEPNRKKITDKSFDIEVVD